LSLVDVQAEKDCSAIVGTITEEMRVGLRPLDPSRPFEDRRAFADRLLVEDPILNQSMTIMSLASRAREFSGLTLPVNAIYDSYNFRANAYVWGASLSSARDLREKNSPGRNDGMDVLHFFYLRLKNTVLLSEDRKQRDLARQIGVRSHSLDECPDDDRTILGL